MAKRINPILLFEVVKEMVKKKVNVVSAGRIEFNNKEYIITVKLDEVEVHRK